MLARFVKTIRRHPWTSGVGVGLLLILVGIGVARWVALRDVEANPEAQREAVVAQAFSTIEERFQTLRRRVRGRAQQLATDSIVVRGLQDRRPGEERPSALVQRVLDVPVDDRTTVEVYTPLPRILAWNGRRMPLGEAPNADAFLQRPQADVVSTSTRRALVVWWPVQQNDRVLGAVRVVRVIQYQPPVKNRHIQGFRLQDEWERRTGESIRLAWTPPTAEPDRPYRLLRSAEGTVLGHVTLRPPSPERLVQRTARVYADALAAGAVLLLGWVIVVVGMWYWRFAQRPGVWRHSGARAALAGRLGVLAALWGAGRYVLLGLDVPGRWMEPLGLVPALFDPTRFASPIGGGLLRSIGDLFLTGLWAVVLAVGLFHLALRFRPRADDVRDLLRRLRQHVPARPSWGLFLGVVVAGVGLSVGSILAMAYVVRRAVLDSTLDFFSRTGLLPDPLMFVVLTALFLLVIAVGLFGVACTWIGLRLVLRHRPLWPQGMVPFSIVVLFSLAVALPYLWPGVQALVPFPYPPVVIGGVGGAAVYGMVGRNGGAEVFTVRGMLLTLFLVTLLFYPLLYGGMDAQRRDRMTAAARSFQEGYDPRALYSIRQVLRAAEGELAPLLRAEEDSPVDSVATRLVRQSLLASLTTYEVSLGLFDADGTLRRRYGPSGRQRLRPGPSEADRTVFQALRLTYDRQPTPGPLIDRFVDERGGRRTERFEYAGLFRVGPPDDRGGWVLIRAEPRSILPGTGPGVPRVLLPDGSFSDLYAELSLAEFRNGRLVRSFGQDFGRTRLQRAAESALSTAGALWRSETVRGRQFLTYYTRPAEAGPSSAIAVRIPALLAFDHLYYMLRLTFVGLALGIVAYLLALYGRYRYGIVPAERVRFRNKVLNAFLIVGVVSMGAVGLVGVRVVTGENERIVERQLHERLTRVEETIALEARAEEPLWRTADRLDIDSLAARVGLDVRVYEAGQLIGTSRPRLVRDGLVDERLPGPVYHDIYDRAYRFTSAEATIGTFRYRVGYQALAGEDGRPQIVVGVPTLAQQEQVAEEQARTLAYLFGALLVLVVVVMLTAIVLAGALSRPIARLREGLEAVGEGRFAETLPVNTRDEVGDLVRTFNEMRAQLAESRRKLAQQEREIAWREMARQVAHEIKNPLTPMKLSIQHLRRAFKRARETEEDDSDFPALFDRVTSTLIEQIESLVRIADEFSTFARLPTRVLEKLDLNEVVEEAAQLMAGETEASRIELDLHDASLPVEADREELRRVYINLIKNALQALPDEQDGHVRVVTAVREDDEGTPQACSWVIDDGTGIPPDVQDKIFEPNFSTKTSGTGLGLAIAKKSLDELGGTIDYETTEGDGTTFELRLPLVEDSGGRDRSS